MEKMAMASKTFTTFFVLFFIAVPIVIVSLTLPNSNFSVFFDGLSKGKALKESTQNFTSELLHRGPNVSVNALPLGVRVHNVSNDITRGTYNNTVSGVLQGKQNGTATEGKATAKNITIIAPEAGSKNASLKGSTNDSTPDAVNLGDKDKLLGGLLASGFDEASCISRAQSCLYRKASPHKPSPYLISKLRNYEEIHRRCGPNGRAYTRSMTNILRSKNNGAAAMCKYLIWTPVNGLGNQMIDMTATFLYAVLTDRVLLVKFGKDKRGLFCEPFINSTWILPKNSPFWNENHILTYQTVLETNNSKQHLPSALFVNLQHTSNDHDKYFHCDHNQYLLQKIPCLIMLSDQYFVPSLLMTPFFNQEITKMFPEKDTVFHHLGRYLFHPSNEAWERISGFYEAHLAKADERVGLQIRVFNPVFTPQQNVMDLVLNCAIKHKLLPEVLSTQTSSPSTGKNQTVKAVLVASLHQEYGETLRAMYMNKATVTGEIVQVYQPSHERHQMSHNNKHNMKAWVDIYLLSLSDVLMTTSLSTFGYVAQGLGNLKPWLLYRLIKNETHDPPCERDFSVEPCYHIAPKHYCDGNPIKDYVSSFLYLRKCKDFHSGVKLVNAAI